MMAAYAVRVSNWEELILFRAASLSTLNRWLTLLDSPKMKIA
jgi:hypothetical protein